MTNLTLARGEDGIAVITWDMPGRSMNVMNDASRQRLRRRQARPLER